jgi:hypothetical protein
VLVVVLVTIASVVVCGWIAVWMPFDVGAPASGLWQVSPSYSARSNRS